MSNKKDKKEKVDVLDQVKKLEKVKKAQVLLESISDIKERAKKVLILKEEVNVLLEEIGLSKTDAKKIVDYVNSKVELTKSDKESIRERMLEKKGEVEEEVEQKIRKMPYDLMAQGGAGGGIGMGGNGSCGGTSYTVTTGANASGSSDVTFGGLVNALEK